jgi:hypothetical protein
MEKNANRPLKISEMITLISIDVDDYLAASHACSELLENAAGSTYAEAARQCINGMFVRSDTALTYPSFEQMDYHRLYTPLKAVYDALTEAGREMGREERSLSLE